MRALVLDAVRSQPEIRDVPEPTAPDGGVVVRVVATGLCRSDWHGWAGHDDGITFPHVPGHELAGVISEVGSGVTLWRVDDRVTVPFVAGCGTCEWCLAGDAQVCPDQEQPGFTYWGSFAEFVAVHAADTNLVRIPESVDFATAASLGCRFATAYRALVGRARVVDGEWVTVVGAGGVGLSSVMIARALGARVIAVDRNPEALAVAAELGAEHGILTGPDHSGGLAAAPPPTFVTAVGPEVERERNRVTNVALAVADLTGGGSHVAVDAVGSEQTCADAILSLRRRGRLAQVGLLPSIEGHPRVPMERVIGWELDLLGSHGMAAAAYPGMMALIEQGSLEPQRLIERTIGLDEAAALLPVFDEAKLAGMTIIDPMR
ncbi:alcohol dehydrogenase catalytic domain-containing protein [Aeromicrobium sp. Marseille-Q0843]|uniref:Alcohol dehydrogenase catalytic domain-containing protein n=1 Tax=Aeromicrobium phoceense TaxID=2754045 RepID=A0A838XQZ8_9ACTN|nr:alcohol dehydrogenase catalytic domain-containing protein [Aeromicrobium phoceense]MBA4609280.1 alcohol dehydrogenase catalytic domain-containing protein [Aeromicrobium phoceense]